MTKSSTPTADKASLPVPLGDEEAEKIVRHAVYNDLSLTDAVRVFKKDRNVRSTVRRIKRLLRRMPGGEDLIRMFLRKGAAYDRHVAARMACSHDKVADTITWSRVPLRDACRGLPKSDKVYQALYNRLYRQSPDILSELTGDNNESGDPVSAFRFFNITAYELDSLR